MPLPIRVGKREASVDMRSMREQRVLWVQRAPLFFKQLDVAPGESHPAMRRMEGAKRCNPELPESELRQSDAVHACGFEKPACDCVRGHQAKYSFLLLCELP